VRRLEVSPAIDHSQCVNRLSLRAINIVMPASVLSSTHLSLWKLLEEAGVDAHVVFAAAGLDSSGLARPGARVPADTVRRLWLQAVAATGNSCLGLDFARHWHPAGGHGLGFAFYASSTLLEAIQRFVRYYRVVGDIIVPRLQEKADGFCLWLRLPVGEPPVPYPALDAIFASLLTLARNNVGPAFAPLRVAVSRPARDCAARFQDFFRAPVEFDAPCYAMLFAKDPLLQPLPTGNPEMVLSAEKLLRDYLVRMERNDVATQVRKFLVERLASGEPSAAETARGVTMSVRTLQRRLAAAGTSFARVLDETRRELALEYLREPSHSVEETAFMLGFAETASFNRAFRRWTGVSPRAYRSTGGVAGS
jgi:AraC-like DNA-binding protein